MKIELILLGVIGLVFLVDFIKNSRKKPSIDNVVDQIEGGEAVKNQSGNTKFSKFILLFTVLVNILITLWIIFFEDAGFFRNMYDLNGYKIEIGDLDLINIALYLINIFLVPAYFFSKSTNDKTYILERKKNFTLFIISIPLIKVFFHYMFYPVMTKDILSKGRSGLTREGYLPTEFSQSYKKSFGDHLDLMFTGELWLFVPATFMMLFMVWFFNDKIKAR